MFRRDHHLRIATVLQALDGELLKSIQCLFGGGTAIALSRGEYRESVDIDFLVSEPQSYRRLRQLLAGAKDLQPLIRSGSAVELAREIRMDQYGIRTMLLVGGVEIKFEIILEGRIELEPPRDEERICGVPTLSLLDMATTKLLANSDRWSDDAVFNRDLIDLAMLELPKALLRKALIKASGAYGESVARDLAKAVDRMRRRPGRLAECMTALKMNALPRAVLWSQIRRLALPANC